MNDLIDRKIEAAEYVFCLAGKGTTPAAITTTPGEDSKDNHVPIAWTGFPLGAYDTVEWFAKRVRTRGSVLWGKFDEPLIYAMPAEE